MSEKDCRNDCTLPLRFPRRPGTSPTAEHGDDCPCCGSLAGRISQDNRPGLSRFNYRIGTYGSIREFLFHHLDKTPELRNWTHRAPDDPAVALIEGAAILGDILTFYQEIYANEAFLRTARWRESISDLVRLLGYRLSPAVGGKGVFAFELKKEEPVVVPVGFPLKATLEELEKPAEFETTQEITAYPWLNRFNLYRPLVAPSGSDRITEFYITKPHQLLNPIDLKVGDRLAIGKITKKDLKQPSSLGSGEIAIIDSIEELHGTKTYKIKGKLGFKSDSGLVAYRLGRTFHHFGYNSAKEIFDTSKPVESQATVVDASGTTPAKTTTTSKIPMRQVPKFRTVTSQFKNDSVTLNFDKFEYPLDQEVSDLAKEVPWVIEANFQQSKTYSKGKGSAKSKKKVTKKQRSMLVNTAKSAEVITLSWGSVSGSVSQLTFSEQFQTLELMDVTTALFHEVTSPLFSVKRAKVESTKISDNTLKFYGTVEQAKTLKNRRIMLDYPDAEPEILTVTDAKTLFVKGTESFPQLYPIDLSAAVKYADFPNKNPVITVFGNLVDADQGKTLPESRIGSGNSNQIFQNFKLPKAPLTYHIVPENTPSETPEADIYVDGLKWNQVDSFFGRGKDEQIYIVREDAEGNSWVQFGDGKTGARLTTGTNNVTAIFRIGVGAYGPLKTDTKVQPSAKLKNLDKIGMPSDSTGGGPAEDGENARNAAPGKVQSLGRIVSLKDFESEASAIPGVASAAAAWQLVDNVPAVVITVLMETGRSAEIDAVRDTLDAYNNERGAARHAVSVILGKRMFVTAGVEYALKENYRADLVEPFIRRIVGVNFGKATRDENQTGLFSLRRRRFGVREYASTIEGWVQNVEGVLWARAVSFAALSDTDDPANIELPTPSVLNAIVACGSGQILSLYDKHLVLTPVKEAGN